MLYILLMDLSVKWAQVKGVSYETQFSDETQGLSVKYIYQCPNAWLQE